MHQHQHEYGVRILKFMKSCQLNWCKLYWPKIHDDIASQQRWKQLMKAFSDALSFLWISNKLPFSRQESHADSPFCKVRPELVFQKQGFSIPLLSLLLSSQHAPCLWNRRILWTMIVFSQTSNVLSCRLTWIETKQAPWIPLYSDLVKSSFKILSQVPYICVSILYLFFSFWLTSLCMTDSNSIHLITNTSISFLFMAE